MRSALLTGVLVACTHGPVEVCLELLEAGEETAAVESCQRAFDASGDPRAGLATARALLAGGEPERALALVDALEGTSEAAGAFELAGRVYREQGDAVRAALAYDRSASLYRQARDDRGAWRASYTLFYMSWEEARYRDAFRSAWQSYEDGVRAGDRNLETTSLGALATTLFEVGDLVGTQRVVRAALEAMPPGEGEDRARLLMLEGLVRLRDGRPALARSRFESALAAAGSMVEPRFFRSAYLNEVDADLQLGDLAAAERHLADARRHGEPGSSELATGYYEARLRLATQRFGEAVTILDSALAREPDPGWEWNLLHLRGRAHEGLANWELAEEDYRSSIEILEDLRRELGFDELKAWLQDERRAPFEALARLQLEHRGTAAALHTVERAKARTFVDAMVRAARAESLSDGSLDLGVELSDRAGALAGLLPTLQSSAAVEPRPLAELLRIVGSRHVLEYFQMREEFWLFSVQGGQIRSRRLQSSTKELDALANRFQASPDDPRLAEQLGSILLPEELLPPPGSRLEVVTDGTLGRVPFAALRRQGRFVVEEHAVTYVPSLDALATLCSQPRGAGGTIRVVGDPLGDLPAAALEAREVATRLGGALLVGPAARLSDLEASASVRLLHLATHTGLGPTGPWLTLADGRVDAAAVLARRVGGELVVLASCASAAREGKGLWGSLGASFLAAGSRAVVGTLWSVEDDAAARLVRLFYDNRGVADPAMALAESQRLLIDAAVPPSEWGAFVVFGSNEPLSMN